MKGKVTRPVSGRKRCERSCGRGELTGLSAKLIHVNTILPEIGLQHETVVRIRADHVGMRSVVSANGKATRRSAGRFFASNVALVPMSVGGSAQRSTGQNREYGNAPASIVGHENIFSGSVEAEICRT